MPSIVYLHGFASGPSSSKARQFRDRLRAAGAQVSVPDLGGADFANLTVSGQLAVLSRTAGGSPVRLVGSSLGGYLAALYAARQPAVERLVLLAPAFCFHRRWVERLGNAEIERWRRDDALEVFHYGEGRTRTLRYGLLDDAVLYEDFPDFHQPALIFHGRQDDIVPVAYSEQFTAGRPNVALRVVDSGHDLLDVMPGILDEAVEFLIT